MKVFFKSIIITSLLCAGKVVDVQATLDIDDDCL